MHEQGTEGWLQDRCGKVTASRISDVMMAKTTAGRQNYIAQLVCERLTGQPTETYTSAAMQHGNDTEAQARAFYEMDTGNTVQEVGFVPHPSIAMTGSSPDGLIGEHGGLELKCPQPAKHIRNLTGGKIDRGYLLQMQWNMACTEREWWDFGSFSPAFPIDMQLMVQRVERDDAVISEIEDAVRSLLAEVDETVAGLTSRYGKVAAE